MFDSSTLANCTVPATQSNTKANALENPDFVQSQPNAGRYQEWIGDGQYASIKSQLVMKKMGWSCLEQSIQKA